MAVVDLHGSSESDQDTEYKLMAEELFKSSGFEISADHNSENRFIKGSGKDNLCEVDGIYYHKNSRVLVFVEASSQKKGRNKVVNEDQSKIGVYLEDYKKQLGLEGMVDRAILLEIFERTLDKTETTNRTELDSKIKLVTFTKEDLDYYTDLGTKIGSFVKYELLRDLEIKNSEETKLIPAIKTNMNGRILYLCSISAEDLLKTCYAYRKKDLKFGYQRMLLGSKLDSIRDYFKTDRKNALFPNSILVNFRGKVIESPVQSSTGSAVSLVQLQFPVEYAAYHIIDGQHRLYGYAKLDDALKNYLLVAAFSELLEQEEKRFFVKINKNQTKIDPNLLTVLLAEIEFSNKEDEYWESQTAKFALKLNESDGPLKNSVDLTNVSKARDKDAITLRNATESVSKSRLLCYTTKRKTSSTKNIKDGLLQNSSEELDVAIEKFNKIYTRVLDNCKTDKQRGFFHKNRGFGLVCKLINGFYSNQKRKLLDADLTLSDFFSELKFEDDEIDKMAKLYGGGGFTEILAITQAKLRKNYPNLKISKRVSRAS
jgi:DGQHR domain-containing protein